MNGILFKYGPGSAHLAFKSPSTKRHPLCPAGELHLVLVGGLTDGLLFAPYAQKLAPAVGDLGWSLVQAQLTSSYQGWGLASLDQDAAELHLLSQHLAQQHNSKAWVLMGHSTGCQDAVRYVSRYLSRDPRLSGVILQAPVSDREYLATLPSWQEHIPSAQRLIDQGRPEDVAFRVVEWDGAAVTARRLVSLCCKGGDDDMFSTDLALDDLKPILGPLHSTPLLILLSGADEAVPEPLRQSGAVDQLSQRMLAAMAAGTAQHDTSAADTTAAATAAAAAATAGEAGGSRDRGEGPVVQRVRVIEGAAHACAGHEREVVQHVCEMLQQLPLKQQQQLPLKQLQP